MTTKIAISEFKHHCLEILNNLEKNRDTIIVTKRKVPIASVSVISSKEIDIFGSLAHKAEIKEDIMEPIDEEWSVL